MNRVWAVFLQLGLGALAALLAILVMRAYLRDDRPPPPKPPAVPELKMNDPGFLELVRTGEIDFVEKGDYYPNAIRNLEISIAAAEETKRAELVAALKKLKIERAEFNIGLLVRGIERAEESIAQIEFEMKQASGAALGALKAKRSAALELIEATKEGIKRQNNLLSSYRGESQ